MKIRLQHVSNSSSSSFVGWGWMIDQIKVVDQKKIQQAVMKTVNKKVIECSWMKKEDAQEWLERFQNAEDCNGSSLSDLIHSVYEDDPYEMLDMMGIPHDSCYEEWGVIVQPDYEETPKQAVAEVLRELEALGLKPKGDATYFEEAWRDS